MISPFIKRVHLEKIIHVQGNLLLIGGMGSHQLFKTDAVKSQNVGRLACDLQDIYNVTISFRIVNYRC